jgi:hypothetical protein
MTIKIDKYTFNGPYISTNTLEDKSGVYTIECKRDDNLYYTIDVGESHTVKSRVENHERKDCWKKNCKNGTLFYTVHYTPNLQQTGRRKIEQEI